MYEWLALQGGVSGNAVMSVSGVYTIGDFSVGQNNSGAVRFSSIPINQGVSVVSAQLQINMQYGAGSTVDCNWYGIKEANTALLDTGTFSRPQTTNVKHVTQTPGTGYWNIDVTAIVNEILAQGGWANGNAMGFMAFNSASSAGAYISDYSLACRLSIQISSTPNLKPTPVTIPVPTFPTALDHGIKISKPGQNIFAAAEKDLFYTSRKKEFRVLSEGETTLTQIAHGLSYAPAVLGYYTDASGRHIINYPYNVFQVGSAIFSDATYIYISYENTYPVYYFIFVDPLT